MSELYGVSYSSLFPSTELVYKPAEYWSQDYRASSVESSPSHHYTPVMNDSDKVVYNRLGSTSSANGKLTYMEMNLNRGWQKRGLMWKCGPNPSWYTAWRKRVFVLKGNFVYYLAPQSKIEESKVLGAIYLKNCTIEKISLPMAKFVLRITPVVPRRPNCPDDETAIFHIKFKSEEGRQEWFEELQEVALQHDHSAGHKHTPEHSRT